MPYAVALRQDEAGPCVVIVRPDDGPLPREAAVSLRVVAITDDHGEAVGVADLLQRAIRSGELR